MENKFKVGDKVVIKSIDFLFEECLGEIGTISSVLSDKEYSINVQNYYLWANEEDLIGANLATITLFGKNGEIS